MARSSRSESAGWEPDPTVLAHSAYFVPEDEATPQTLAAAESAEVARLMRARARDMATTTAAADHGRAPEQPVLSQNPGRGDPAQDLEARSGLKTIWP